MIVVDTNVLVLSVIREDPLANEVIRLDPEWVAPPLWRSEFRSALAGLIRVEGLPLPGAEEAFAAAEALVVDINVQTREVLSLVATSPCTAYDLEFVALAGRFDVPLVTLDRQLLTEFPGLARSPRSFVDANA